MFTVFTLWACLFGINSWLKKPLFPLCLVELPFLIPLFFVSKRWFTWWMLTAGYPHRDIVIDGELYLRRWFLTPRHWKYKIFLHDIRKSDAGRDMHCHPWGFTSLTLSGGYIEHIRYPNTGRRDEFRRTRFGSLIRNAAIHVHQVSLYTMSPTWTLLLVGPAERSWGFWVPISQDVHGRNFYRFVDHKDYLGLGEEHDQNVEDRIR